MPLSPRDRQIHELSKQIFADDNAPAHRESRIAKLRDAVQRTEEQIATLRADEAAKHVAVVNAAEDGRSPAKLKAELAAIREGIAEAESTLDTLAVRLAAAGIEHGRLSVHERGLTLLEKAKLLEQTRLAMLERAQKSIIDGIRILHGMGGDCRKHAQAIAFAGPWGHAQVNVFGNCLPHDDGEDPALKALREIHGAMNSLRDQRGGGPGVRPPVLELSPTIPASEQEVK